MIMHCVPIRKPFLSSSTQLSLFVIQNRVIDFLHDLVNCLFSIVLFIFVMPNGIKVPIEMNDSAFVCNTCAAIS